MPHQSSTVAANPVVTNTVSLTPATGARPVTATATPPRGCSMHRDMSLTLNHVKTGTDQVNPDAVLEYSAAGCHRSRVVTV